MKKIIVAGMLLFAGVISAQSVKPTHEIENNIIKSTYFYDNGNVKQSGYYKDGKLHGSWVAYNEDGTKQSMGEYVNGQKSGKWFFWTGSVLNEVDYSNSRIADIKKWSKDAIAVNK
ncbi:toxin-antitoxin system YwqK family antitoxin [Flavobacterium subsaxonicum]|uniref:Membrane-binding protein n=1 Tax=Flavobacterium subsaxonicum WB 4.1-42 = DSM 21790 TaxID=1121898 RepID=A0A0A2MHY3_9FLAO|nr:membrane-binding protein [Flavobacterium subsaxonicum]KGO92247.1 membrane-binding protein [Flavobacterium subsaxonicum WB 4.1-42 = DSM 21790]